MPRNKEESFGFKCFDGYQKSISTVGSRKSRYEIVGALNELFWTGESQSGYLKGTSLSVYLALEDRVLAQRSKAFAGRAGGKASDVPEEQAKVQAEVQAEVQANADEDIREKNSSDNHSDIATTANPYRNDYEIVTCLGGFEPFYAHAINAYNASMGTAYTAFPGEARRGLQEAFENGHTESDTDAVIAVVASWEPKYRTPNAAFADGRYEQWLFKGKEPVHDHSDINAIFG